MARQEDRFDRQIRDAERERDRQARQEKWAKREKKFFRTFLFTEDGKPKSSFGIYTFCLSFVFLAADVLIYGLVIDGLHPHMQAWPTSAANLVQSLAATALTLVLPLVIHRLCKDKRLAFGTYLWLALYAVAVVIAMAVMLRGSGATGAFLVFFGWFVAIPLAAGLAVTGLLCRRDHHPQIPQQEDQPWKKYTDRR